MYCKHCGTEIDYWEKSCKKCGGRNDYLGKKVSVLAIIVCVLMPIVGIILWLTIRDDDAERAAVYGRAGIVLFCIEGIIEAFLIYFIYVWGLGTMFFGG